MILMLTMETNAPVCMHAYISEGLYILSRVSKGYYGNNLVPTPESYNSLFKNQEVTI